MDMDRWLKVLLKVQLYPPTRSIIIHYLFFFLFFYFSYFFISDMYEWRSTEYNTFRFYFYKERDLHHYHLFVCMKNKTINENVFFFLVIIIFYFGSFQFLFFLSLFFLFLPNKKKKIFFFWLYFFFCINVP